MSRSALISKNSHRQPQTENHPPATNRGVETLTQERIDWISFTVPIGAERIWPDGLSIEFTERKSFNGYDLAYEYEDGRIELKSSTRPEMGVHCVLSGSTCSNCRNALPGILENCWMVGGKVTRFDLALDDLLGRINPRHATKYIERGEVVCRAKQYPIDHDPTQPGYSQYAGRMASEVHLCLYDKAAEQKECTFTVRAEIRFKHGKADKAAKTYLSSKDCRGLILGFINFPTWREWGEVFATEPIKVPAEKTRSRRVRWLLGQVSMSIAKEVAERGGDLEILSLIRESVMAKLSDMRQGQDDYVV